MLSLKSMNITSLLTMIRFLRLVLIIELVITHSKRHRRTFFCFCFCALYKSMDMGCGVILNFVTVTIDIHFSCTYSQIVVSICELKQLIYLND